MPHLIAYLISLTWVLTIGAGPLRADPEQVYSLVSHFDGYTIGVNFEENPQYRDQQGSLDLIVNDGVLLRLKNNISRVAVIDASGQPVPWEEAKFILARALSYHSFLAKVLPAGETHLVRTDSGHSFAIPQTFLTSARLAGLASSRWFDFIPYPHYVRAAWFKQAVLRAVALEETRRFDGTLHSTLENTADTSALLLGLTDEIGTQGIEIYKELRIISSSNQAIKYTGSAKGVAKKVHQRVSKTPLAKAGHSLGLLTYGVELAVEFNEGLDRNSFLAEVGRDVAILQRLHDVLVLMKAAGNADPAMIEGLQAAIDELAKLSKSRLRQYVQAGSAAFAQTLPTLGVLLVGYVSTGGAAVVTREVLELGDELGSFEEGVLTASALLTMGQYLHSQIDKLRAGNSIGKVAIDTPTRPLLAFQEHITAEATASVYNILWKDRWSSVTSLAGLSKGVGLTISEWRTAWGDDLEEEWRREIERRVLAIQHRATLGPAMPSFLADLRQVYAYQENGHLGGGQTIEIGQPFRDCAACPEMVVVPKGSFLMGSPSSAKQGLDEGPRHTVWIDKPFAVGVYEVTFAEWDACVAAKGCRGYRPDALDWGRGRRPVINVSWKDAQAYVSWLSRETDQEYRLLSEAEWEYAARAQTETPFHVGWTITTQQANYRGSGQYELGRNQVYRAQTVPVGSFAANEFGLHDVHGNVLEWVADCWNVDYKRAPSDGSAWMSGDCSKRVLRGGYWSYDSWGARSAKRYRHTLASRGNHIGFRVARTVPELLNPPLAQGTIEEQVLTVGAFGIVEIAHYFVEPDGEPLTYSATSSQFGVVRVRVEDAKVTIVAEAEGTATVTVMALDPSGLAAEQRIPVRVATGQLVTLPDFNITVPANRRVASICVYDHATEDGDKVRVSVNGVVGFDGEIFHAPSCFETPVNEGPNVLEVFAYNEGRLSPNTAGFRIEGLNRDEATWKLNKKTGSRSKIIVTLDR